MKVLNKIFFYFGIILFFCSCKNNENSFMRTKTINNISYNLQFCPKEENKKKSDDFIELADLFYYKLTISEENKASQKIAELYLQSNYNKLLYYVNQNIQSDFKTIVNKKELTPVQVYFESNNRITQKLVFLLAFEKPLEKDGDLTVEFNDNIFNNGKIKFKYDIKELI